MPKVETLLTGEICECGEKRKKTGDLLFWKKENDISVGDAHARVSLKYELLRTTNSPPLLRAEVCADVCDRFKEREREREKRVERGFQISCCVLTW